ncbi:MAG TPA: phage major capsid protein, partial [Thermomicrobiales bacterium]|nr:phage major capsid protein [Thermomicrobiales bacterium]
IVGDSVADPKSFDGLRQMISGGQLLSMGTDGGALSLGKMDELVDAVVPGKPDLLLMSKRSRRKLKDLRRSSGAVLEMSVNQFGERIEVYDGIPVVVDDFMPDNETQGTGTALSSIYALKFGQSTGLMGLEHGGITVEPVGSLETKDATRTRIKWYAGLALFNSLGVARLSGITAA